MHVVFDESNPFDPRKDLSCVNDIVDEFLEVNLQDNDASKPLKLEALSKKEQGEVL